MSVETIADRLKNTAVASIKEAIAGLSEIVINQCSGHDDWNEDYREDLKKSLYELIEIRDRLS